MERRAPAEIVVRKEKPVNRWMVEGGRPTCGQSHKLKHRGPVRGTAILISLKCERNKSICDLALVPIRKLIKIVNMGGFVNKGHHQPASQPASQINTIRLTEAAAGILLGCLLFAKVVVPSRQSAGIVSRKEQQQEQQRR